MSSSSASASTSSTHESDGTIPDYLLAENQLATDENVALFNAASNGELNALKRLLRQGAKPNFFYRPEDQKNALHVAAENGFEQIVSTLVEHGAEVDAIAATDQTTALVLAARSGSKSLIQKLVSAGANVTHGKEITLFSLYNTNKKQLTTIFLLFSHSKWIWKHSVTRSSNQW